MARRNHTTLLFALGLLLGVGGRAAAGDLPTLGADGEIYRVVRGSYGDLFPGGSAAAPANPVLALDIDRPGVATERLLVPTTGDEFPEDSPSIILDPSSQTPFLVWERWVNFIHPELNLVHLTGEGWSEVAELSGSPFRQKSSPTFAITHDSVLRAQADGQLIPSDRTIVHLVWLESSGDGTYSAQYTPVVIQDGAYLGWNPVYRLNDLLANLPVADGPSVAPDLSRTITIAPGEDNQSVNIAVADPASGRLATVTARAIPRDLTEFGDALSHRLVEFGSQMAASEPGCRQAVADFVRQQMIDIGNHFQSGFASALTEDLTHQVLASEQTACDVEALAPTLRTRVAEFGASFIRSGIAPLTDFARQQMTDIGNRLESGSIDHQILLGLMSDRPMPATGVGKTSILVSRSGNSLLVAWEHDGLLSYRETRGNGWSGEFALQPQKADGWTTAYQALRDRISDR